ncbi:MAG TPA: glycosyltransferase [Solirubrobacteraceae bacterium]|jgi:glycosyltransferase involved in cell wall biosynthesis
MRVAIVAEYYPRAHDPVLGIWAHRQAAATAAAGAGVHVLVLHRPVPPRAALKARDRGALLAPFRQPLHQDLDGVPVTYVPFLAPPRPRTYATWGRWAAPTLAVALRRLRRRFPFDLVHAHYAAPAGDAVLHARAGVPLAVSVHGGDLLAVAQRSQTGARAVGGALSQAAVVLANSAGMERRARALGAERTRVVHLGSDVPAEATPAGARRIVTVGSLIARKRHADVLRAMWLLRDSHPQLEWVVVGDGPERGALEQLAGELSVGERVRFLGSLPHTEAVTQARRGVFVLPSVNEAFGVAYVEAMAGGVPAIGCLGEDGPEEIAAAGDGIRLVPPADPEVLAGELDALLSRDDWRRELGAAARATVARAFTWEGCGRATVEAYEQALRA